MLVIYGILFYPKRARSGSLGRVVDLELWWVVFDDLFTSRKQWAPGGERSHYNMVCATLNRFFCGDPWPARAGGPSGKVDYSDEFSRVNPRGRGGVVGPRKQP